MLAAAGVMIFEVWRASNLEDTTYPSFLDGFFTFNWKPEIEGQYTVYASFAGSESYWPSHTVSSFAVDPAPPAEPEPEPEQPSMSDTYILPGIAAIIATIVIIGAILALLLVRKRA